MTRLSRPQRVQDYAYTKASPVKIFRADGTIEEKPAYDRRELGRIVPDSKPRPSPRKRNTKAWRNGAPVRPT